MKKLILFMSVIAFILTSCGKPKVSILEDFEARQQQLFEELDSADYSEDEQIDMYTSLIMEYLNDKSNINSEDGKTIFKQTHYYLSNEQMEQLFSLMNKETLSDEKINMIHNSFLRKVATDEGQMFTDFSATTPDGGSLALSDLVGNTYYVLVDFWASWCGPCRMSMPALKELYEHNKSKLEILGVSLDEDKDKWLSAIESLGLSWKHISDLQGWKSSAAQTYGVNSIPATVLINKEGIIVGRNLSHSQIEDIISNE